MRLREACAMTTALALFALTGCGMIRGHGSTYLIAEKPETHFKSDANTPHAAAQNDIALAEEYIKLGKYDVALDRLQHAVKTEPSSPDGYTMLGLLYEKINRLDQAEANYARSVKLAPNKGDILNNYGAWLCRSGHPADADPWFRKAIVDPFYKTPMAALGNASTCALRAGNPALAESYDRQILALDAGNVEALQTMAKVQYQHGDYMRARGFVERLFATGNTSAEMLDLAAQIEDKLGDHDSARDYRNRLTTEYPQYTPSQL